MYMADSVDGLQTWIASCYCGLPLRADCRTGQSLCPGYSPPASQVWRIETVRRIYRGRRSSVYCTPPTPLLVPCAQRRSAFREQQRLISRICLSVSLHCELFPSRPLLISGIRTALKRFPDTESTVDSNGLRLGRKRKDGRCSDDEFEGLGPSRNGRWDQERKTIQLSSSIRKKTLAYSIF